jgi:DNA-directed RNA polymerase subunit RPC12/RpoP
MVDTSTYLCTACKKSFPFEKITYASDGNIVCRDCSGKIAPSSAKKQGAKPISSEPVKLICMKCHYKFSFKKGSNKSLRCPYCSSGDLMKDESTADKIIEDVTKHSKEYL